MLFICPAYPKHWPFEVKIGTLVTPVSREMFTPISFLYIFFKISVFELGVCVGQTDGRSSKTRNVAY